MILAFDQQKIPRSTSRSEWREIDRWRRITQKKLAEALQKRIAFAMEFGLTELLDEAVNPPVMFYP